MGDWIKENKFEAGLLFLVLLAAVAAFVIGGKQGDQYATHKNNYDAKVATLNQLEALEPYPTDPNADDYEEEVKEYRQVVEALQDKMLAYRPEEFQPLPPAEFTDRLNARRDALARRYSAEGIDFPSDKWHLGFERYTTSPPRDAATAYLSYQLDALDWLFGALADAKPSELVNVVRKELPVEAGEEMEATDSRGNPIGPSKPFYVLPLELTFKGPEPAVRDFLARVAGSDQHFFVIRTLRIQNEKRNKPPEKDDVDFRDKPAVGKTPFGSSFDLIVPDEEGTPEGETPAPDGEAPPAEEPLFPTEPDPEELPPPPPAGAGEEGDRILGQILGAEELYVFLQLDLLLFKEKKDTKLPETAAKRRENNDS